MTATAADVGRHAQAVTLQGIVHATGQIVAYCDSPTVTIADPAKGNTSWRAELTHVTHAHVDHSGIERTVRPVPSPAHDWREHDIIAAERARIIERLAAPDSGLLSALIGINETAKLMREWFLAIVMDEEKVNG